MTWTSAPKDLPITAKLPYKSPLINVIGRVPVSSSISFDWLEFMVATAKASHLGYVAPNAAAPEVELMFRLVGPHVDDTVTAFGILATVMASSNGMDGEGQSYRNRTPGRGIYKSGTIMPLWPLCAPLC